MGDSERVLDFWFGNRVDDAEAAAEKQRLWWSADAAIDAEIGQRFGALVESAGRNELADWAQAPRGLLALILLTDQFPRNMFRKTPRAFAFDPAARAYCRHGIARGFDRRLRPIERVFHYLPLEHSEAAADQEESVRLFAELAERAPPRHRELYAGYLRYAERHREIIQRFGRFCHRNAILGRPSSPEEVEFLKQPGSSF
ncbi:MAG TPA: DUF924 family protein [Burkholderiales bacterium]|jgi:uncharacterized protein (DUF924 family)|nr:DUF924 family protein [Burkholderiales bacterium]